MQHAINQCYECMRAIKDRISRPASQLAITSIEPLYHAQQVSRWKSLVRDLQGPSAHQTGTHGNGDRPAEPPLCPAWLPEDPANGFITSITAMSTLKAVKSAQFVPSILKLYLTDSSIA
ncbi:hypothetical protein F511_42773 [Dorcoceras hygrometricum]|uniref:Uncharacterized protein n=1 Tax=Dorcoceras hygrometricum TaxID=472368 RepID=A0A2Z7C8A9_9LAMI|nr:hypothetical protein F511_42773 [Dorcoceras hygrometricum]